MEIDFMMFGSDKVVTKSHADLGSPDAIADALAEVAEADDADD